MAAFRAARPAQISALVDDGPARKRPKVLNTARSVLGNIGNQALRPIHARIAKQPDEKPALLAIKVADDVQRGRSKKGAGSARKRGLAAIIDGENDENVVAVPTAMAAESQPAKLAPIRPPAAAAATTAAAAAAAITALGRAAYPGHAVRGAEAETETIEDAPMADVRLAVSEAEAASFSARLLEGVRDVDAEYGDYPLMVGEYAQDIYAYMRQLEARYHVPPRYMERQPHIDANFRAILVDWITEVHYSWQCQQETLYLTVHLLDRVLDIMVVKAKNLQLVGMACMLIACKYEEIYTHLVSDFVHTSEDAFTCNELINMEQTILARLQFNLGTPTPVLFLRRWRTAADADDVVYTVAKYLMELSILSYDMLAYAGSEIAAAALYMAMQIAAETEAEKEWSPTAQHYSGFKAESLRPCMRHLEAVMRTNQCQPRLRFIRHKYSRKRFGNVTALVDSAASRWRQFSEM